jgi:hypothetical protein
MHAALARRRSLQLFHAAVLARVQGGVLLTIGYHQLEGKRQALKKPMAILSKVDAGGASGGGDAPLAYEVRQPAARRGPISYRARRASYLSDRV